jgi:hypothetical protein
MLHACQMMTATTVLLLTAAGLADLIAAARLQIKKVCTRQGAHLKAGNQNNKEQVKAKLRKCNILQSNIVQEASKVDSTQGIFHDINTVAWCQLTRTRTSNVAGNAAATQGSKAQ